MKKIILILIITTSSIMAFSQTRSDIKNITLNDVYATIGNDSIKNYVEENIEDAINFDFSSSRNYFEIKKHFVLVKNFLLFHNKLLTIFLAKFYDTDIFCRKIKEIEDSLTVNDLNSLIKVALFKARIGNKTEIRNGVEIMVWDGIYTTESEGLLEILQQTVGEIMERRYKIKVKKPESLTQTTTPQWYLSIINKALKEKSCYKKELKFLKKEIEEF